MDRSTSSAGLVGKPQVIAAVVLIVGWVGLCAYAYPGYLSFDSVWQLREARSGVLTDWHPPAMAALWGLVDKVVAGPFGMFFIQSVTFLAGVYLVVRRYVAHVEAAVLSVGLTWFPPIATTLAVIWKDSQMLGFLMLGTGLLLSERRTSRGIGLLALVVASAMRHNGLTITLAIVVLIFRWSSSHRSWKRYLIAVVAWIAITGAAFATNAALVERRMYPWHGSLALFDIVGTIRFAPETSDRELLDELAGAPLLQTSEIQARATAAYRPFDGVFKIIDDHFFRQPTTAPERAAISRAWWDLVLAHPGAYLDHRWHAFRELLVLRPRVHQWVWVGFEDAGIDLVGRDTPSGIQEVLWPIALWFGTSWLMRPYFYLLLVIALVPFAIRARERTALALAASAIISELALFFLSPTPDFRYSVWLVCCAYLMTVILIVTRARARRPG